MQEEDEIEHKPYDDRTIYWEQVIQLILIWSKLEQKKKQEYRITFGGHCTYVYLSIH